MNDDDDDCDVFGGEMGPLPEGRRWIKIYAGGLRFYGDDRVIRGRTALDCLRYHCNGDHSPEGRRGDVDGVMKRLAGTFKVDPSYEKYPTLEERADAFVAAMLRLGVIVEAKLDKEPGSL